ncbi:FH1/FH2 domain-containing protein 3 isoform X3 [Mus musculus]|uniref:FH1/FH2 domain-containing protein 3 isoform X3 n=1 Tax=Mus musculus TaxID=10090 RepID=UPI0003D715E7|nr:FH1/FH2 domain-containing protein 3 isoform X3 [Mus musculus]|eukprot:XP_006525893.1 PREDICTED: FH1/FH2 domain-containing protein 3 isoform X3 [Mus musculus]
MATLACRVQFLDDTDPFNSTNFPEPSRPPLFTFREDLALGTQLAGVHRLLRAPHKLDDCTLQLSHNGAYLDLEATLAEQRDELEGFQDDTGRGKKNSIILRTQLSVRVHACIEKLYNSSGRDLRRALFSLKQIFQDDKDLVHEFVIAEGLTCLIKVGAEADQNYQNYILRALGQIMLYVDGMNGVINHSETIQWLYTLVGSKFRLVVKTALKLLLVFVEYSESNAPLLIQAVSAVDTKRGVKPWSNIMEILEEKDGVDTELLVYAMTLVNKTLAGLPDQDTFYDVVDCLEELGIAAVSQRHLNKKGTDLDLLEQFNIYEVALRHEDGDETAEPPPSGHRDRRRASMCSGGTVGEQQGLDRRRSRRHSIQNIKSPLSAPTSPCSPSVPAFKPSQVRDLCEKSSPSGLLTSSFRQHQESLAAERERRRQEREERLQRIEREERNKFNREYLDKREEQRQARGERYKYLEQLAAETQEKEPRSQSVSRGRADLSLDLSLPAAPAPPSPSSQSPSADSQEALPVPSSPPTLQCPQVSGKDHEPELEAEAGQGADEASQDIASAHRGAESQEEPVLELEPEERASLSEKERQNEEVNERDNCSASSISSSSSTLEREEKEDKLSEDRATGLWSTSLQDVGVNGQCGDILTSKRFMLDMLYAHNRKSTEDEEKDDGEPGRSAQEVEAVASLATRISTLQANSQAPEESIKRVDIGCLDNRGSVKAFAEKFNSGEVGRGAISPDVESQDKVPDTPPAQLKTESDYIWDQLMANPRELRIQDMDFTDLGEEDDIDVLDVDLGHREAPGPPPPPPPTFLGLPPPPPPPLLDSVPPPPVPGNLLASPVFNTPQGLGWSQVPRGQPAFTKKKKTIRLFWNEVRPFEWPSKNNRRCREFLWSKLEPIKVDTSRLEHLFESKSKELSVTKKTAADGKRQEIIVLDSKRSNAINIGLTVLPPPRTIKIAILNFDEYALNKEGIEKILTMIPTEEEKQKIQEAQLANPEVPLGSAEQFLLTLSSISELSARLHLWAFKMDYETTEKEVAEPLLDLKEGIDQLENNKTLGFILSTLLAIGNFLNGTNAKAFELSYLEKVPEVKDTVHKQSLLHHVCTMVVENFPDSSDLYSEIGAITRSAKVDFDQLQDNLCQMERRCKASWDHLKAIAKHEMKPVLKQRMSEFLKDCAERIIILKIVHRRIINRFHSFLLFMGHPPYAIREVNINKFCRIISEFALEYRTTRERVLQQKQKRANHRERNKTRGKMITDTDDEDEAESGKFSGSSPAAPSQPQGLSYAEDAAEHENMKAVLKTSSPALEDATPVLGVRTRSRASRGSTSSWTMGTEESPSVTDDAADEIMDRIVKSATQVPSQRVVPRERKRSRANRKSLRRTLKSGLTPEEARALGLVGTSELQL